MFNLEQAEVYYNKGVYHTKNDDFDSAIEYFSKAIELNPNYASAYYKRGLTYAEKGDDEHAK